MLLRNVHVNAIADYYDIPQLRQLANTKIQSLLETSWAADGFCSIVDEVFNSTRDTALHDVVTSTAASHIEELIDREDFGALEVMSNFAITIMQRIITRGKAKEKLSSLTLHSVASQLQDAEDRLLSAELDGRHQKSLRDYETTRADRTIQRIDDCLDILSRTRVCRNSSCRADFNCYVERGGFASEPKYTLRCAKCRCRHQD